MDLPFLSKALGVRHTGPIFISHFLLNFFTNRPVEPIAEMNLLVQQARSYPSIGYLIPIASVFLLL